MAAGAEKPTLKPNVNSHQKDQDASPLSPLRRESSLPQLAPQTPAAHSDFGAHFGVDIGGTLTKIAFLEIPGKELGKRTREFLTSSTKYGGSGERDSELSVEVEGGTVHFVRCSSADLVGAVQLVGSNDLQQGISKVYTAGGGAYKYAPLFREKIGVELVPADELDTIIRGISWLAEHVPEEVYVVEDGDRICVPVKREDGQTMVTAPSSCGSSKPFATIAAAAKGDLNGSEDVWRPLFPMLVVNIGTGVSILKVNSSTDFERVSGTALGGGTYWGLCQLLTGCRDFEEASKLALSGDASEVNLEVRDIYGGDYKLPNGTNLPGNMTASFFAKADEAASSAGGVLRALATMIAQNICQIALLNTRIHDAPHVVFTGNFLRQNPVAIEAISANFSRVAGVMRCRGLQPRALFLRHEGYFGALGSLLQNWQTCLPELEDEFAELGAGKASHGMPAQIRSSGSMNADTFVRTTSASLRRLETPQSKRKHPNMSPGGRHYSFDASQQDAPRKDVDPETPASPLPLAKTRADLGLRARQRTKFDRQHLLAAALSGFAVGSMVVASALMLWLRPVRRRP